MPEVKPLIFHMVMRLWNMKFQTTFDTIINQNKQS